MARREIQGDIAIYKHNGNARDTHTNTLIDHLCMIHQAKEWSCHYSLERRKQKEQHDELGKNINTIEVGREQKRTRTEASLPLLSSIQFDTSQKNAPVDKNKPWPHLIHFRDRCMFCSFVVYCRKESIFNYFFEQISSL